MNVSSYSLALKELTRSFIRTRQHATQHDHVSTSCECFHRICWLADPTVGYDIAVDFAAFHNCRQLRDAKAGLDASSADGTAADPDFDDVAAGGR